MENLFVLYEHAAGYALFSVKEFEEIGLFLPQVEQSITDLKKFNKVVKLCSFWPFKGGLNALENINSISEGIVSEDLKNFLNSNLMNKGKVTLGVADPKLGAAITDAFNIQCSFTGVFPEIIRGIRFHFTKLVKNLTNKNSEVAQLGLGHSYSRAKVKFNVHRVDNMIIQSISLLDVLDKDINTYSMRIREWYSFHFPELYKIVPENCLYSKTAIFIRNRKDLDESKLDELAEIVQDREKAEAILDASRSSMGMDISPLDLLNIEKFATNVVNLVEYREKLCDYLKTKMGTIAPNTATLLGEQVGARLIAHAGSLTNLAKLPASTIQVLGAEKALFRALKAKSTLTPKYGLLYHSSFLARAEKKNKGRISRFLANKCSVATRIDCFSENPTNTFGVVLKKQVEDRLNYYVTGEKPAKNIDVMKQAVVDNNLLEASLAKKSKKSKKKSKDVSNGLSSNDLDEILGEDEPVVEKKKKKKSKKTDNEQLEEEAVTEVVSPTKKRKLNLTDGEVGNDNTDEAPPKKKKKKKSKGVDAEA